MNDIPKLAAGLSEAQRRWLTKEAIEGFSIKHKRRVWTTYPPPNTHEVLVRKGLVDRFCLVLEKGLALRDYLKGQPK